MLIFVLIRRRRQSIQGASYKPAERPALYVNQNFGAEGTAAVVAVKQRTTAGNGSASDVVYTIPFDFESGAAPLYETSDGKDGTVSAPTFVLYSPPPTQVTSVYETPPSRDGEPGVLVSEYSAPSEVQADQRQQSPQTTDSAYVGFVPQSQTSTSSVYSGFVPANDTNSVPTDAAQANTEIVYEIRHPSVETSPVVVHPEYATSEAPQVISSAPLVATGVGTGAFGDRAAVQAWIQAAVDRSSAERYLLDGGYDRGAFCVRASRSGYALAVLGTGKSVIHFRLLEDSSGQVRLFDADNESDTSFPDIHELVAFYSAHPLSPNIPNLVGCIPPPQSVTSSPTEPSLLYATVPGDESC